MSEEPSDGPLWRCSLLLPRPSTSQDWRAKGQGVKFAGSYGEGDRVHPRRVSDGAEYKAVCLSPYEPDWKLLTLGAIFHRTTVTSVAE